MNDNTRQGKLLTTVGVCFLLVLGSLIILPAVLQADSSAGVTNSPTSSGLSPFVSEGGNTTTACSDVTTCTTGAITNVDAGDTLVVEVTEFTTSKGDPSAVEEIATGHYTALTLIGSTTCIAGSGHGVSAVYGLSDVAAETSVTFMANYSTASYYTIHALNVEGVASAPFETAGVGVCSGAAATTGTASVTTTAPDDLVILAMEVRASTTFAASGNDTLVNEAATTGADLDSGAMLEEIDGATGSISLSATFADASWAGIAVALKSSPLVAGTVSPSTAGIDSGQTIALSTTVATGGTSPYTYHWYAPSSASTCSSGTSISGAAGRFYTTPALTVGTYFYCVWVTDSSTPTAEVAYSNVATVTVNPALSVVVDPNAPSIDSGQTVLLTAEPTGGTGADTYAWYSGATCIGAILATTQGYTTPALTAGTTYCVAVTDSSNTPVTATATATVTVSVAPLTVVIAPSSPAIDTGQAIQLTAEPSGGTGPYTYAWYSGSSCSGTVLAVTQNFTTPALTAGATYCVVVTDSASTPGTANATVTIAVSASPLTVAISPSAPTIDQGHSVLLTAEPSGGTGADSFAWYSGSTCSGTPLAATQAYTTPDLTDNSTFCVTATDSAYVPETAHATATVTVTPSSGPGSGSGGSGSGTGSSNGGGLPTYVYPILGVLAAIIVGALLFALLAGRKRKVTFTESGLPEGTKWSVTFQGEVRDSTSSSIAFDRSKGEHPYNVGRVSGYAPTPASGVVKVGKDPTDVKVAFKGLST